MQSTPAMVRVAGFYKHLFFILTIQLSVLSLRAAPTGGEGTTPPPSEDQFNQFDQALLTDGQRGEKNPFVYLDPHLGFFDSRRLWEFYGRIIPTTQFEFESTDSQEAVAEASLYIGRIMELVTRGFIFTVSLELQVSSTNTIVIEIPLDHVEFDSTRQTMKVKLRRSLLPSNINNWIGMLELHLKEVQPEDVDLLPIPADWRLGTTARLSVTFPPITNVHNGAEGGPDNFDSAVNWNTQANSGSEGFGCGVLKTSTSKMNGFWFFSLLLSALTLAILQRRSLQYRKAARS